MDPVTPCCLSLVALRLRAHLCGYLLLCWLVLGVGFAVAPVACVLPGGGGLPQLFSLGTLGANELSRDVAFATAEAPLYVTYVWHVCMCMYCVL